MGIVVLVCSCFVDSFEFFCSFSNYFCNEFCYASVAKPRLVVVDGKSSDRTPELAKDMGAEVFTQNGKGKGNAISQGICYLNLNTAYIAFTDADTRIRQSTLKK